MDDLSRPRLLDLFSGSCGGAMGYHRAGLDVVGIDINPHPRYPFRFVRADALHMLRDRDWLDDMRLDAIHASPPCHDHTTVTGRNRKASGPKGTGWMLAATISHLQATGLPFVVENVDDAKFPDVYRLRCCGSMFDLNVERHRWFASNMLMLQPQCQHYLQAPRFRSLDSRRGGKLARVVGVHGHLNYSGEFALRCEAMGIDWMTNDELSQ